MELKDMPVGTQIHNIEMYPGHGGQLVRAAGVSAQLMAKEGKYAIIRMPSGEMRMVPIVCRASIGQVGNTEHNLVNIGKAGRKRHMGIRPTVRGSVMNPNDHPHGGGEGLIPICLLRPALPRLMRLWSPLPTTPIVARHTIGTILISPEGSLNVAYFPSLAIN